MGNLQLSVAEMKQRVALFSGLKPSSRPLVDAVLPQYQREIFQIIGGGVIEDPAMRPPIAADGFHLSIVRCEPGKGTGLHNHKTVEVFMPLTGRWSVIWGDQGESELQIGQYDTVSIPPGVLRGFRNDSDQQALLLALVGGDDPGKVAWEPTVLDAVKEKGFGLDEKGQIVELGGALSAALWQLPATRLAAMVAAKEVSPVEVMDAVLAQAERQHARLNLFALPLFEQAREAARAAEVAVMAGGPIGPLHGVPITVKDNVAMAGLPMANGSVATPAPIAAEDWAVVARLRAAGAIPIGKTTLPEFAHKVLTDSPQTGITRNPWHLERTPGGSSGGASAALAAGVAPLAIGTDGGGSIRCPASCTGVVGLKATLGRIPNETFPDPFGNYAFVGPMARTVADCALMASVLEGVHPFDVHSLGAPPHPPRPAVKGLRIGWVEHFGEYRTHAEVLTCMARARAALEAAGAILEPCDGHCFDDVFGTYVVIATTAHAARLGALEEKAGERMTASLRESIGIGRRFSAVDLVRAVDRRGALFRTVQRLFARFDLIATPTMLAPPTALDAGGSVASAFYANWAAPLYPFNLTGHPAASVPAGFSGENTPIGVQLVGPWHGEARILAAAATLEQALGWPDRWPLLT